MGSRALNLRIISETNDPHFTNTFGAQKRVNPYLKQEHNDYIVVSNEEGEATFKQFKKYGKTTRILHPLNPHH